MNEQAAREYWNSKNIVDFFSQCEPPKYWHEFFSSIQERCHKKVLDAGCGGGRNLAMLLKLGYDAVGCDLHENMVQAAQKHIEPIIGLGKARQRVLRANICHLHYEDGMFDFVLSNGVLHNVGNLHEFVCAVKEIARTLKADGTLAFNIFTNSCIDINLLGTNTEYLYITPDNLDMLLLAKEHILKILEEHHLVLQGEIVEYTVGVFTGNRSVMRGMFKKVE